MEIDPQFSELNTPVELEPPAEWLADDRPVDAFTWEDSFAIARRLRWLHPDLVLEQVSLGMILRWTMELPGFADDPALANEGILNAIYQEWYEEANPV
jgi:FeS assembly protein IscX